MISCPNKSTKEWKSLSKELGEDKATLAFIRNNGEIPDINKARDLITNRGLLEGLQNLPILSEKGIINTLKTSGIITGEGVEDDGKIYYQIDTTVEGVEEKLSEFTTQYGGVIDFKGDMLTVVPESIGTWNNLAAGQRSQNKSLNEICRDFLSRIGVSLSMQDDVIKRFGSNGIADIAERMVRIQSGMENEALPEEALHFFIEMLPQDHPALVAALDKIRNTNTYKATLEQYKNNPNYRVDGQINFTKIKKEALAKEMASSLREKEKRGWLADLLNTIINWIKGLRIQKEPIEILQDLFLSRDMTLLNTNLQSSEIYNQLSDEKRAFYEAQMKTAKPEQQNALNTLLAFSANVKFDEATHTYRLATAAGDLDVTKSVTKLLGSDFDGLLQDSDVLSTILLNFESEFPGVVDEMADDAVRAKQLADHMVGLIRSGELTEEYIESIVGEKVAKAIATTALAQEKTLFGTAIHDICEAIIMDKFIDVNNLESVIKNKDNIAILHKFISPQALAKLINGTVNEPGLADIIKEMRKNGSIVVPELEFCNAEIGAKMDIIEVKSDGVVEIHDFKTKFILNYGDNDSVKKDTIDEFNAITNRKSRSGVKDEENTLQELIGRRRSNREKYSQQLSIYKKMLMEVGVKVGGLHIIGIPYRLDAATNTVTDIKIVKIDNIPYDDEIAEYYFNFDKAMDANAKVETVSEGDKRIKDIESIKKDELKKSFAKSLAKLTQIFRNFGRNRNTDELYKLLTDEKSKTNKLQMTKSMLESTLENFDDIQNFLAIQQNFLELIDSSAEVVEAALQRFNELKKLTPTDREGASQRLNEMMKVKDLLAGYESLFKELIEPIEDAGEANPVKDKLNRLIGVTRSVRDEYIKTITPDIVAMLGDVFSKDLLDNIRLEYNEMIASAKTRGDLKRVEILRKERDGLPSARVIEETLKGNNGDVGWFFGKLLSTISNPDIILAGAAKRLKASLDRVRIKNKEFRDSLSIELEKRWDVYGKGMDVKKINSSLVYVVEEFNPATGKSMQVLHFKSEYNENLYTEHNKLQFDLNEAIKSKDKDKTKEARKKLRDFEKKYLQTGFTDEYYKLTAPLDKKVMYQGRETTVRLIEADIRDQINNIERLYTQDDLLKGKYEDTHLKELQRLYDEKSSLREKTDKYGNPKKGDDLVIAEALEEYDGNKKYLYDSIEQTEYFNRTREKVKLQYGEDSEQYKKWMADNTRIVISDEYYKKRQELFDERTLLLESISSSEISDLYKELRNLTKPYKDKDGTVRGSMVSAETAKKIKDIQEKIDDLQSKVQKRLDRGSTKEEQDEIASLKYAKSKGGLDEDRLKQIEDRLTELYTIASQRLDDLLEKDPDIGNKQKRVDEINKILASMSNKEETKYYFEELANQERIFAEAMGITVKEMKKKHYKEFKESDWYQQNHIIERTVLFEDEITGETKESVVERPTDQWMRNMPVENYITRKPANHFNRTVLKESYIDDKGNEIKLQNKDNLDILGRLKPKTNEQYRQEYGTDHPYLDKDFKNLKTKNENKTATPKEKVDYENLLYIHKQMLEAQEGVEIGQRLGFAVPFLEKKGFERAIETGGASVAEGAKGKIESLWDGIKRSVTRTDQDVDQEGLAPNDNTGVSKLATMDNNELKFVPVRFSTKGEAENASYDVWGGVLNYVAAINRKGELDKELAFINGVEEILSQESNQPKSEDRNMILSSIYKKYLGAEFEAKLNIGTNTRLQVFKSFVNSVMYNEEYFKGFDVLGINTQKALNVMMGLNSLTILGAAPLNWGVNWISGNIQNLVEAAGGRNFTFKEWGEAHSDIYGGSSRGSAIKDMQEDYTRVGNRSFTGQLMEFYDPLQGEFENELGEKTNWNGVKNIFKLGIFAGKVWGEWEIQMKAFYAFMRNHKLYNGKVMDKETFITQKIGVDVENLSMDEINKRRLDALQEWNKLTVNLLDMHEMGKDGKLKIKDEYKDVFQIGSQQFSDIVAKLHAMQKKLNGSYAKFDKSYAEKTSIGRMAYFFRKYFLPIGMNRWGERRVNYESMTVEQGFYLTFLQTVGKDLVKMKFNVIKNWHNYSPTEKAAIKRTLADIGIILAIIAMYSLVFGYDPNDPDRLKKLREKGWAAQAAVFILLKAKSETEQFLPPLPGMGPNGLQEITRMYTNPSLILTDITQYAKITNLVLEHTANVFTGGTFDSDLYYQKKASDATLFGMTLKDKGDSKLFANVMKTFVGYTGKTFNPVEAIKGYEYMQSFK